MPCFSTGSNWFFCAGQFAWKSLQYPPWMKLAWLQLQLTWHCCGSLGRVVKGICQGCESPAQKCLPTQKPKRWQRCRKCALLIDAEKVCGWDNQKDGEPFPRHWPFFLEETILLFQLILEINFFLSAFLIHAVFWQRKNNVMKPCFKIVLSCFWSDTGEA